MSGWRPKFEDQKPDGCFLSCIASSALLCIGLLISSFSSTRPDISCLPSSASYDASPLFSLNATCGDSDFVTVKITNIAWDLILGRGGQLLMAFVSWKVALAGLVQVIESSPVSYQLYTALLFNGNTFTALWALCARIFTSERYLPGMI